MISFRRSPGSDGGEAKSKLARPEKRPFPLCCLRAKVQPEEDGTEDLEEEHRDGSEGSEDEDELPSLRITLFIDQSENVKVRDFLAGSAPYLLVKPDGGKGKRPMMRTVTEWVTPNAIFGETFEFDVCPSDLPIRIVVWDHLEEPRGKAELRHCSHSLAQQKLDHLFKPHESHMRCAAVERPPQRAPPPRELDAWRAAATRAQRAPRLPSHEQVHTPESAGLSALSFKSHPWQVRGGARLRPSTWANSRSGSPSLLRDFLAILGGPGSGRVLANREGSYQAQALAVSGGTVRDRTNRSAPRPVQQ